MSSLNDLTVIVFSSLHVATYLDIYIFGNLLIKDKRRKKNKEDLKFYFLFLLLYRIRKKKKVQVSGTIIGLSSIII